MRGHRLVTRLSLEGGWGRCVPPALGLAALPFMFRLAGAILRCLVVVGTVLTATSAGAESPSRIADLLSRAHSRRLAEDPEWLLLIHYDAGFFGGRASEVDPGDFFLSPRGSIDHEAELAATLEAFLAPVVAGHEDPHALCRFPARRKWLDNELHFLRAGQSVRCPDLDGTLARLDPTGVQFVYASAFLGNPASAFGHAFLHLTTAAGDRAPPSSATRDAADRGIEFRAITNTKNPFLYAFEGVVGLFAGNVEPRPYDIQARAYTAEQGRDLWEYDLALSGEEVTFLVLHMWELRKARIDYYYLTRNCALEVLELLQLAAPRLGLFPSQKALVFPIDALRAITVLPGLVRGVAYRPSLETRLHARLETLTGTEDMQVRRLLRDPMAPWPVSMPGERRAAVLDAAIFEVEAHSSTDLERKGMTAAKREWQALVMRRNGAALPEASIKPDWDVRPDLGHAAMRIMLGTGVTSQYGDSFGSVGYRLTLHDLTDPPDGSPELAQVVILDTRLRYGWARRALTLDNLTFADVLGLNPISVAEPRLSFRTQAFGLRLHDRGCPDCFAHGLDGSVGATIATHDQRVAVFAMADAYVAFLPHLTGLDDSFVRLGVGPHGGLRVRIGETVGLLTGTVSYLPGEKLTSTYDVRLTVKTTLARDIAMGIDLVAQPLSVEAQVSSYLYF